MSRREHVEVGWYYDFHATTRPTWRLVEWHPVTGTCRLQWTHSGGLWWQTEGFVRSLHAMPPDGRGTPPDVPPPWWAR